MQNLDPRTPVLVGIGIVEQKEKDPARAREAIELMSDAVRAAGADAGTATLLAGAERIYVPQGMWGYADPARMIARAIGATNASSVFAKVGVLQQTLLGDSCRLIAGGEIACAIVVAVDARYRLCLRVISGRRASEAASPAGDDRDSFGQIHV